MSTELWYVGQDVQAFDNQKDASKAESVLEKFGEEVDMFGPLTMPGRQGLTWLVGQNMQSYTDADMARDYMLAAKGAGLNFSWWGPAKKATEPTKPIVDPKKMSMDNPTFPWMTFRLQDGANPITVIHRTQDEAIAEAKRTATSLQTIVSVHRTTAIVTPPKEAIVTHIE